MSTGKFTNATKAFFRYVDSNPSSAYRSQLVYFVEPNAEKHDCENEFEHVAQKAHKPTIDEKFQ